MKPFQGIIRGSARQPVTQLGTKTSGMIIELNTVLWGITITAQGSADNCTMQIELSSGSNGPRQRKHLLTVRNQEVISHDIS